MYVLGLLAKGGEERNGCFWKSGWGMEICRTQSADCRNGVWRPDIPEIIKGSGQGSCAHHLSSIR